MEVVESSHEVHLKKLNAILIQKKVKLVPIKRESSFLPTGHDGEFQYTDTYWSTDLPVSKNTGQRISILNREQQEIFERELNLDKGSMSFYDKDKGFWASSKGLVKVTKEGLTLDLSQPMDYIRWLIIKESPHVAPSYKERFNSGIYKYALVDEEETTKDSNTRTELMKKVYMYFGKIDENSKSMQDVLKLYGKKTTSNKVEFLRGEIQNLIDKNPTEFVSIMSNKHFNLKVKIEDAIQARAIERTKDGFKLMGGDLIGRTQSEVIEWFENPNNSDLVLNLQAKIDNFEPGK